MKTKLPFFLVFLFSASFLYAQQYEKTTDKKLNPDIKIYDSGKQENIYIPPRTRSKSSKGSTALFKITYTGFSDEAKVAFQAAADIWSNLISSPIPIAIDAYWEVMEPGILGSSGSPELFKNFKNAPFKDTWYKPTVANRLAGIDLNPDTVDIIISYNSTANWYLGTDGNAGTQTDFVSVVLHEIGHGLGFAGGAWRSADRTQGLIGYTNGGENLYPVAFDHFMYNGDKELLMDSTLFENPSAELLTEFTSNDVFFDSPLSNAANGGTSAELYAPYTWNTGSSISHLAETYNNTENALMTYSIGTGEAEHDLGPIAMGIFAEIGWVSVRFDHDHLKDIETWSSPITISAEIYADTALYDNSVYLHYSIDNFATDNKVLMTTLNDTLFTFDIPVQVTDTIWYYIEAKSKLDRYYFYPSQGEGSIDASFTGNALYFINGSDNINPDLIYEQKTNYIFNFEKTYKIEVEADDNVGIDSVYIEYKINENIIKKIRIPYTNENSTGLPKYEIELALSEETLNDLDTLYYKIIAIDESSNTNSTTLPKSGYYKLVIHEIHVAETNIIVDFDETGGDRLFILDDFTIGQPSNFNSKGLHSPHPYMEGDGLPNNEVLYTATLKTPVILNDTTILNFDEIVLVEPGGSGSHYGDDDFWDYVIVEGSKDTGKTWHDFADGYDCSIDPLFITAYIANSDGNGDMYLSHQINLLENQNFAANDKVLIRFRLWSDQLVSGWGWAIDNIKIQTDTITPTAPASLEANEITDSTINLIWLPSADNIEVTDYVVYKNNVLLEEVTDTTYKAIDLTATTTYSFFVKAKDAAGNTSKASNTINPTTAISEIPTKPTLLTTTEITDSTINITWKSSTDNVGVTAYEVYKDNILLDQTEDTTYQATGLTAATTYSFYIKAKDAVDNLSEPSNTIIATTTDSEIPTTPTLLTAIEITDVTISIIWQASTDNVGVTAYEVYKDNILLDQTEDTTYQATGLTAATTYSFYIKAKDAIDNISEASDTIHPKTLSSTNVENIMDNAKYLKLYPNPTAGYFSMEFNSEEIINKLNISIYSIDGKLVYSSCKLVNDIFIKEQINIKSINTGTYIIKLNTGKNLITEKLLIK